MATRQLCDALDEGRGIGLHCIISHQHMSQLSDEDQSGYLYHSVMADARTKLITGGLSPDDLKAFGDYFLMDYFDPLRIKYIQKTPSHAPVETVRKVTTYNTSKALSQSKTENYSEADSTSHAVQHSVAHGHSVADSLAETEGEQESYTHGVNSSNTESHNWGTADSLSGSHTQSQAHTDGIATAHGRSHGRSSSDGTSDSYSTNAASGWSRGNGRNSSTNSSEGQTMREPEEGLLFESDPEIINLSSHTGAAEGTSSFTGTSGATSSSAGQAHNSVKSKSDTESDSASTSSADTVGSSDTDGWSTTWNEGHGTAHTEGNNEAWTRGNNRSTTRGNTITNSEQVSDGYTDTVGNTITRGKAVTEGVTITSGESETVTPFYEYRREEIETPVFLSPEEQKLLVMQELSQIPKRHFFLKAPGSKPCLIRAPYVADPIITKRRLAAGLQTVYSSLPCYTTVTQQGPGNDHQHDGSDGTATGDIIDVEVREVNGAQHVPAHPSSAPEDAPVDPEVEAALWETWTARSRTYKG
jgi:hypothetical protein